MLFWITIQCKLQQKGNQDLCALKKYAKLQKKGLSNLYLSANQPISIPVGIYIYKYININTFLHKILSTNVKLQKPWYDDVIVTKDHMVHDKEG